MRVSVNLVLLFAAAVLFVVGAFAGFGWWEWAGRYTVGWVSSGLACWVVAGFRWEPRGAA